MNQRRVDLTSAEAIYAVSNVPLYLLRKLQANAATQEISSTQSAEEILNRLRSALQIKPGTLREAVEPYVLMVALAKKRDLEALKSARALESRHHDWFAYLADVLEQTSTSSTTTSLIVPGQISAVVPANTSSASTRKLILNP